MMTSWKLVSCAREISHYSLHSHHSVTCIARKVPKQHGDSSDLILSFLAGDFRLYLFYRTAKFEILEP